MPRLHQYLQSIVGGSRQKALAHSGKECNTSSNRCESIECHCLLRVQCWKSLSKAGPQHPYIDHIAHITEQVAACKITPRAWCVGGSCRGGGGGGGLSKAYCQSPLGMSMLESGDALDLFV